MRIYDAWLRNIGIIAISGEVSTRRSSPKYAHTDLKMLTVSRENPAGITVVSDDTDVFVFLVVTLLHAALALGKTLSSKS